MSYEEKFWLTYAAISFAGFLVCLAGIAYLKLHYGV